MYIRTVNPNIQVIEEIYNEALISIEDMCLMMSNKILYQLGITAPNRPMDDAFNQEQELQRSFKRINSNKYSAVEPTTNIMYTLIKVVNGEFIS